MASISEVKTIVRITPARLKALIQALSDDVLNRAPAPGEWSPIEVLRHLIYADRLFAARARAAIAGDFSAVMPSDVDNTNVPALELIAQFEAARAETLVLLDEITDDQLELQIIHPRMGLVTVRNMLNYWGGHDLMHLIQIEQAVMQPFIPDSGPWQVNFAKHILNGDAT